MKEELKKTTLYGMCLSILKDNVKKEHYNEIVKNDETEYFVSFNPDSIHIDFNHDYYNKWKLKNKIDNF